MCAQRRVGLLLVCVQCKVQSGKNTGGCKVQSETVIGVCTVQSENFIGVCRVYSAEWDC